jgi:phage terminase small subunit
MARAGRPPTPISQRELTTKTGNIVPDKSSVGTVNKNAVVVLTDPVLEVPKPPDLLRVGRRGRRAWRDYWTSAHWLTLADYETVVRLCVLIDHTDAMLEYFEANGIFGKDKDGVDSASGPYGQYLRAIHEMLVIEDRLGLSPVERSRIRIESKQKGSPLDAWRDRRKARAQ